MKDRHILSSLSSTRTEIWVIKAILKFVVMFYSVELIVVSKYQIKAPA